MKKYFPLALVISMLIACIVFDTTYIQNKTDIDKVKCSAVKWNI